MKTRLRCACAGLLLLLMVHWAGGVSIAQHDKSKDPLTDEQTEEVREVADRPVERIKLYMKFIEQRTSEIHRATMHGEKPTPDKQNPDVEIHNLLQEFTRLSDELQDNLDSYADDHSDIRKPLKELVDHSAKWPALLNEPKPSSQYDFARKTALDTAASINDMAKKLLTEQEQYFTTHKPPKQ